MPQRMPRRRSVRQEDLTGSYVDYRLEKDADSGIEKEAPVSEDDDSSPRDVVKGRTERKIAADMEERALKEAQLQSAPFARSDGSPLAATTDANFPKLSALSAQMFHNRMASDGPRIVVRSTQVISGREATEGIGKTTDAKVEVVMGDNQIVTSKGNDPLASDLEVQNTQHLPNTERAPTGPRTLTRLAAMKAGTSLTIPPSALISELQEEADFMHRFK